VRAGDAVNTLSEHASSAEYHDNSHAPHDDHFSQPRHVASARDFFNVNKCSKLSNDLAKPARPNITLEAATAEGVASHAAITNEQLDV
jgi:hypothetical protein